MVDAIEPGDECDLEDGSVVGSDSPETVHVVRVCLSGVVVRFTAKSSIAQSVADRVAFV